MMYANSNYFFYLEILNINSIACQPITVKASNSELLCGLKLSKFSKTALNFSFNSFKSASQVQFLTKIQKDISLRNVLFNDLEAQK